MGILSSFPTVSYGAESKTGTGGPDVTQQVNNVLSNVASTFAHWNWNTKISSMKNLISGFGLFNAWDIDELREVSQPIFPINTIDGVTCGTGAWEHTVTFDHKVYWASAVNYALWGKINKLSYDWLTGPIGKLSGVNASDYSYSSALANASAYKNYILTYSSDSAIDEAWAFTRYGYSGQLPTGSQLPCQGVGQVSPGASFGWLWNPGKP